MAEERQMDAANHLVNVAQRASRVDLLQHLHPGLVDGLPQGGQNLGKGAPPGHVELELGDCGAGLSENEGHGFAPTLRRPARLLPKLSQLPLTLSGPAAFSSKLMNAGVAGRHAASEVCRPGRLVLARGRARDAWPRTVRGR